MSVHVEPTKPAAGQQTTTTEEVYDDSPAAYQVRRQEALDAQAAGG